MLAEENMTYDSRTFIDSRHRRTILIAALIVAGVCLLVIAAWLSLGVPVAVEDEGSLIGELSRLP